MTNFRALISRMANELDYYRIGKEGYDTSHPLAAEARAALAAEAEGEELRFDGGYESGSMWTGHPLRPAALAAPEPPADGEVAELVNHLLKVAAEDESDGCTYDSAFTRRAAELLERLALQPVPEGPSDEELLELAQFHCISYTLSNGAVVSPFIEDTDMRYEVLSFARALLALRGNLAPQSVPEG